MCIRDSSTTVAEKNLPECLEVTARSEDGDVMGVRLKGTDVYGIQFHPEDVYKRQS